jgi:predicted 3-demethylubiquinone-9 3-methyltransferase (glyoxalase superfamily)
VQKIVTFLWFDNQAEEAATFYVSLFPDSRILNVNRVDVGSVESGKVTVVDFQLAGQEFMALNGGPMFTFTEAVSLYVNCRDQAEIDELWSRLTADGGEESQCGWLKDKYGLSWQIVPIALGEMIGDPDPAKSARAVQAMLQMRKLDVATLRRAFDGG